MCVDRIEGEKPGKGNRRPEGDHGKAQNRVESPGARARWGRTLCNVDGHPDCGIARQTETRITEIITLQPRARSEHGVTVIVSHERTTTD